MAWALKLDGVNDYLSLSESFHLADGDYIDFKVIQGAINSNYEMWAGTWDSGSGEWYFGKENRSDGVLTLYSRTSGARGSSVAGVLVEGEQAIFRLERVLDGLRVLKDGVEVISLVSFGAGELDLSDLKLFFAGNEGNTSFCFTGQVLSVVVGGRYDFNMDVSDHGPGAVLVTETVSGKSATGVNMPTDGSAWVDLGGGGVTVTVTVTEILNSFVDASNVSVDYNVSLLVTESFKQFTDSSIVSIESAESVTLSVTESFNKFIDSSSVNTSKQVSLAVTEILKSFEDGSNISIAKDVSVQVTEIMASFTDNSSVRLPANWNNKPVAVTSYTVKTPTTTIWIDKG